MRCLQYLALGDGDQGRYERLLFFFPSLWAGRDLDWTGLDWTRRERGTVKRLD